MVAPLRVAFFGTPSFALTTLERIVASRHAVVVAITQPDRPRGRGQKVRPSPVKAFAVERGIPVLQPERLRDESFLAAFDLHQPDIAVVAAYGRIVPPGLLSRPRLGMINVHASLLPRWRGAAPVHRAILAGDRETGVTIMRLVAELDAGPMLARERVDIAENETSVELEARLAARGSALLVRTLDRLSEGALPEVPQPDQGVTYAARLERHESRIDWAQPAAVVHNHIRGLQPWPMATVLTQGRRLRLITSSVAMSASSSASPGTIVAVNGDGIVVAASPGAVRLSRVQPEGKPAMSTRDYLLGHRLRAGDRFDPLPGDR